MIGHYLLTLSEAQEDRVLTRTLAPGPYSCGCLVGTIHDVQQRSDASGYRGIAPFLRWQEQHDPRQSGGERPGILYDDLCGRFGAPRVNAAIRNRILSNRARRVLQNIPVGVGERTT